MINKEVYLNGVKADEPYTFHKDDYIAPYRDNFPGEPNGDVESGAYSMLSDHVVNGEVVVPPKMYSCSRGWPKAPATSTSAAT